VLVAGVGAFAYRTLETAERDSLRSGLETILDTEVAALRLWAHTQRTVTASAARDPKLKAAVAKLVDLARDERNFEHALPDSPVQPEIQRLVLPLVREQGYFDWGVIDHGGRLLAAGRRGLVGARVPIEADVLDAVLAGETVLSPPTRVLATDPLEEDAPVVLRSAAPVPGADGEPIAVFELSIPAEGSFTEVLRVARTGNSGETYAFDRTGTLLSASRFEDQLWAIGIVPAGRSSILQVQIRDPGGNLLEGFQAKTPVLARPLTRMAASAVAGERGVDIEGYRDYRGVPVVGAWTWLPDLGFGLTTELDVAEAYAGLATVRRSFAAIAGLLALAALGMLAYSLLLGRARRQMESALELGRYRLVEKIGEGGMGKVFRARHALLRRPTAVKLLESSRATQEAVKRFEREVQIAASLTHPNTIAIYDYGHTPDGSFYYAMEYLEGVTIADVVSGDGAQPEARVLYLLRQAAASLAEAHTAGLVHRDLKPSNIMVCSRGGQLDFVKVLDFGLVRAREDDLKLTGTHSLTGTPLYLAPEALQAPETVDARSDVYQLGAIGYALLTGRPVFEGETIVEVLSQHLHTSPTPPSAVLGRAVSPDLEKLVLACLEKDAKRRPRDGSALLGALEACSVEGTWTQADARAWWDHWALHEAERKASDSSSSGSLPSGWHVDLGGRVGSPSRSDG
jgi:hypothetical protein